MENNRDKSRLLLVTRQGQSRYAFSAENVVEVITSPAVTPLPGQPDYLRGLISYKGRVVPVLSLRALRGLDADADEPICVMIRMDDLLLALTVDSAESLMEDNGRRVEYDESLLNGKFIKLDCAIPGDPVILVLNLKKVYQAVESHFNS